MADFLSVGLTKQAIWRHRVPFLLGNCNFRVVVLVFFDISQIEMTMKVKLNEKVGFFLVFLKDRREIMTLAFEVCVIRRLFVSS